MSSKLTWLGHGSWQLESGDYTVLVDPFLTDNPKAPVTAEEISADFILISHGHFDHISDTPAIANRTGAKVVAIFEIAQWLGKTHGIENVVGMNIGGGVDLPFGRVKMTVAHHSSELPDGSSGGVAAGFVVSLPEGDIYFACDTALFSDMKLIGANGIEVAVLPIGDLFTMGPDDSIEAIKLIEPNTVIPAHYGTWPPIEQDAEEWARRVQAETKSDPFVLEPGGSIKL